MRLVELLARELDEWPEGASLVVQDCDGEVKYQFSNEEPKMRSAEVWIRRLYDEPNSGIMFHAIAATDHATAIVTREMWEAERAKVKGKAEWNGEGLPPVGQPCELRMTGAVWIKATPMVYGKKHMIFEDADGEERIEYISKVQARPIRTPELIAAQEREDGAREMIDAVKKGRYTNHGISHDAALALFDAGYRKQEQSE